MLVAVLLSGGGGDDGNQRVTVGDDEVTATATATETAAVSGARPAGVPDVCENEGKTQFAHDVGARRAWDCVAIYQDAGDVTGPAMKYLEFKSPDAALESLDGSRTFELEQGGRTRCPDVDLSGAFDGNAYCLIAQDSDTLEFLWHAPDTNVFGSSTFDPPTTVEAGLAAWQQAVGIEPTSRRLAAESSFNYEGPAFGARLPNGDGWGRPAQSEPTPGQLFRTSVRGPDGLFVIIDYTPAETPTFRGEYDSRDEVGQTAFGSATRYVFQGGTLPECQRARCVDYLITDASDGSGFGVLAGGPDFDQAMRVAQTVAESVVPR